MIHLEIEQIGLKVRNEKLAGELIKIGRRVMDIDIEKNLLRAILRCELNWDDETIDFVVAERRSSAAEGRSSA